MLFALSYFAPNPPTVHTFNLEWPGDKTPPAMNYALLTLHKYHDLWALNTMHQRNEVKNEDSEMQMIYLCMY